LARLTKMLSDELEEFMAKNPDANQEPDVKADPDADPDAQG
jgi:hypothetical protein